MLARRPLAPPGPVGEVTAGVSTHDFITHNEAKAERELTLGSDGAGAFDGYESEEQAAIAASSSPKVGVVVADQDDRFHAYETDLDPAPVETYAQPYDLKAGRVVRWTRLRDPGDPAIYEEQMRYAGSLASSTVAPRVARSRTRLRSMGGCLGCRKSSGRPRCVCPIARPSAVM